MVYQSQDPVKFHLIKRDDYLAYWRPERRNNYKEGREDTLGPVFETQQCFHFWYLAVPNAIAHGRAVIDGTMDRAAIQDFAATIGKEFSQFSMDITSKFGDDSAEEKKESELSSAGANRELRVFMNIMRFIATVLIPLENEFL